MEIHLQEIKDKIVPILRKYDVDRAGIFGSYIRGETKPDSDLDILVRFRGKKSLLDLAGLKADLEESLNMKVDVLTYNSLHPLLKKRDPGGRKGNLMKKDPRVFIGHVLECIEKIEEYTKGKSKQDFLNPTQLQDAVILKNRTYRRGY